MSKQWYEVKPGYTHGKLNEHKPGDKVELSPEEAQGFLDKLQLAADHAEEAQGGEEQPGPADEWGGLAAKALTALQAAGMTAEQVKAASDEQLLAIDGIGAAALKLIRDVFPITQLEP